MGEEIALDANHPLAGQTLKFEVELMDLERTEVKHNDKFKCFFEIDLDGEPSGRIVMELRGDVAPKTCENFRALCHGGDLRTKTGPGVNPSSGTSSRTKTLC